ncbi:hypothetical protein HN51_058821 [Arachis hypogaea]
MKNPATSAPLRACRTVRASVPLPPWQLAITGDNQAPEPPPSLSSSITLHHQPPTRLSPFSTFLTLLTCLCSPLRLFLMLPPPSEIAPAGTYINKKFPSTATISIQGCIVAGICHSAKMTKIRRTYLHFIQKYQRQGFSTFL